MAADTVPPKFLSLEFHTRFFPRLLLDRFRRKRRETRGTTFTPNLEMFLILAASLILAMIGIPMAAARGSILGWVLALLGAAGSSLVVILSVGAQWGSRPCYDDFLAGVFSFFVAAGAASGVVVGLDAHSAGLGLLAGLAGLLGGYLLGILAGLALQYLGWIATILNMAAVFAAICLAGGALLVLLGSL